ncbi:anthranilate synthase component I [Paucilactobacillus hokkaidonensis JCM 18461]|uniref:Anthranilate synthase component 1 n=2 Tax=Paucilactobacillus hokkaidonensis TaxID=1193095 RepID=A0A0A1H068_9LACO|nr:anthranilate synthase component I family protein [Paucilactobacillus hokkaidonensis]BAP86643.1 anthranilate synthase component I [Paucilactobacillus hokkaidonensis JCM 18461]
MKPELEELKKYSVQYQYVPVKLEFKMPQFDVYQITDYFDRLQQHAFQLTINDREQHRFTYLVTMPKQIITVYGDHISVDQQVIHQDPHSYLEHLLERFRTPKLAGFPPFSGGISGYFAYEYAKTAVSKLAQLPTLSDSQPLAQLLLVDEVIVYDQQRQICQLIKLVKLGHLATSYGEAFTRLTALKKELLSVQPHQLQAYRQTTEFLPQQTPDQFAHGVEQVKQDIHNGEIFQLIYSNPQIAQSNGSLIKVAQQLATDNPSPYQFYFHQGDYQVAVASPETLVAKQDEQLLTYPLAGTRRRGHDQSEDQKFERELTTSVKELSEHNMLVDLGRNDLGRVSQIGSVKVTRHAQILRFSQVMHLGSTVEAQAKAHLSALDLLDAVFPAGTLSGAPKVRAMELIYHYEQITRGIYGGCFGYFDFNGDVDMAIGIRLVYRQGNRTVIHSGAGIVADSDAKHEYQECFNKARAVNLAVQKVSDQNESID